MHFLYRRMSYLLLCFILFCVINIEFCDWVQISANSHKSMYSSGQFIVSAVQFGVQGQGNTLRDSCTKLSFPRPFSYRATLCTYWEYPTSQTADNRSLTITITLGFCACAVLHSCTSFSHALRSGRGCIIRTGFTAIHSKSFYCRFFSNGVLIFQKKI